MKILMTGADRPLGKAMHAHLDGAHDVVGTASDLRDPDDVAPLVDGVDAVLHLDPFDPAPLSGPDAEQERLDIAARGSFVLLEEAVKAGVARAVVVSRLALLEAYPDDYVLEETFRALPDADAESLAPYLAEQTFREFARQGAIRTICLRFGELDARGGTSIGDAVKALARALEIPFKPTGYRWQLFHVATDNPRFPLRAAAREPFAFKGGA